MTAPDYLVILAYLGIIVFLGLRAGGGAPMKTAADFFLAGRKLPWWVLGTSMVATTLAADTPLTVAGLTLNQGIAGNWFWWSFVVSHVLVALVLARLWRRAGVVTDAEFCELRYPGRAALWLRGVKAFYFALPINCIVMGWVFLAMIKVSGAVLPELPTTAVAGILLVLTLGYSVRSGFRGVVLTDLVQFPLALGGAILLAWFAVDAAGGLGAVVAAAEAEKGPEMIDFFPVGGELLPWHSLLAFLGVQWWAQKSSDGGGIFIQRMLAARSERDAELGGLWFCVAHYVLRPWPWILTGLAALVLVPEVAATDAEAAYPALIVEILPAGARGLLVASFLAAFMSTIDTHLNWGASYVVNDLVGRFRPVSPEQIPRLSRWAVVAIALAALAATSQMSSIEGAWKFLVAFGAGAGAVVLLRWYWWRITAEAEIAAIAASTVLASGIYLWAPEMDDLPKLAAIAIGSALIWIPVMLITAPAPGDLADFYRQVRPPGPGWQRVAEAAGEPPPAPIGGDLMRWAVALAGVLACLFGVGGALLGDPITGSMALVAGLGALAWIARGSAAAAEA